MTAIQLESLIKYTIHDTRKRLSPHWFTSNIVRLFAGDSDKTGPGYPFNRSYPNLPLSKDGLPEAAPNSAGGFSGFGVVLVARIWADWLR